MNFPLNFSNKISVISEKPADYLLAQLGVT
jgi:hypothetical protein